MVYLISNSGIRYEITREVTRIIDYINDFDIDCKYNEYPIIQIEDYVLKYIVDYLILYEKEPMEIIPEPLEYDYCLEKNIKSEYYVNYIENIFNLNTMCNESENEIDIDQERDRYREAFKILNACELLGIQPLASLICAKIASTLKNKSPDKLKYIFT